jgi:hypothetical protein
LEFTSYKNSSKSTKIITRKVKRKQHDQNKNTRRKIPRLEQKKQEENIKIKTKTLGGEHQD